MSGSLLPYERVLGWIDEGFRSPFPGATLEATALQKAMPRVLIVEDEPRIAAFMQKGLQQAGIDTDIASNGNAALSAILDNRFDLLLLDLGIPGKDGASLLQELRSFGFDVPVIIVTAQSLNPQNSLLSHHLANELISKPFRISELLNKVQQILQ